MMQSGDPRVARSRRVIMDATIELLVERGVEATTVEAIAERSGAAKTTIYRHWPGKEAVLRAAIESIIPVAKAPDTGSLRGDLTFFAHDLAGILTTSPTSALIPVLISAAERDDELAHLLAAFTAGRRMPIHAAVARATERGETAADPELIAGLLLGPLFYRRLLSRTPLEPEFVEQVATAVLASVCR